MTLKLSIPQHRMILPCLNELGIARGLKITISDQQRQELFGMVAQLPAETLTLFRTRDSLLTKLARRPAR